MSCRCLSTRWLAMAMPAVVGVLMPGRVIAQQPTVNVTVTVPKPSADWKAWSTDPAIALVVLQTTLNRRIAVSSTVSLIRNGKQLGQLPGNIAELPTGTRLFRTPQIASWSRMVWSDVGATVGQSGKLPPGTYQLCLDIRPPPISPDNPINLMAIHRCAVFTLAAPPPTPSPTPTPAPTPAPGQVAPAPNLTNLPPPRLISPANRSQPTQLHPTFQWTPVVSAAVTRPTYLFRIAEISGGATPEAALNAGRPLFEREVTTLTTLPYPASAPPLQPGRRYAWRVQALAMPRGEAGGVKPLGMNQGLSQIYTFQPAQVQVVRQQAPPTQAGPVAKAGILYNAALSGHLNFTFQPNGVPKPRRVSTYVGPLPSGGSFEFQGQPGGGHAIGKSGGGAPANGGPLRLDDAPRTAPLAGVTVRLVVHYRTANRWIPGTIVYAGGKSYDDNNRVIASTVTGADGGFTFLFHDDHPTGVLALQVQVSTGSGEMDYRESGANLARFYTLEVGDAHYANPSDELERGGSGDVGTLVALVRSYKLQITVVRAGTGATKTGLRVQLLRPYRAAGVPASEGTAPKPRKKHGLFEIIGEGISGIDGTVNFFHLVKNIGPADRYSVRVSSDPNNATANYYPASVPVRHEMLLDDPAGYDGAVYNEDYRTDRVYRTKVPISPKPPEYVGTVRNADSKLPLDQALMVLVQHGVGGSMILHGVKPDDHGKFVITGLEANRKYVAYVHSPGFLPDSNIFTPDSGVSTYFDHQLKPDANVTFVLVDEAGNPVPGRAHFGNDADHEAEPVFGNAQGEQLIPFGSQVIWSAAPKGGLQKLGQLSMQMRPGAVSPSGQGVSANLAPNANARVMRIVAWRVNLAASSGKQTLHVDAGPEYFPTDTVLTIPKGASDLGQITVYIRLRRLAVKVVGLKALPTLPAGRRISRVGRQRVFRLSTTDSPPAIKGATVRLTDQPGQPSAVTDGSGMVNFAWKATSHDSVAQVTVEITPPPGSDYFGASPRIPVTERRTPMMSVIGLLEGGRLQGTVYAGGGTDSVVAGARVFLAEAGPGGGDLADTTDAKGHYLLHGVPTGVHQVRAGKAGSDLVGDSARVTAKAGVATTQDFHLAPHDGLPATLLGLPIEVAAYQKTPQGAVISGRFTKLPSNDAFILDDPTRTLAFDSVRIVGSAKDASPVGGTVHVAESELLMSLYGKYLVVQRRHGGLEVSDQGGGKGGLIAPVALLPGSFAVTSAELTFTDSLHLLGAGATGAGSTRLATLVAGGVSPAPATGYAIGTAQGGDPGLSVYGFATTAKSSASRLTPDALQLDVTLHTAIPGLNDLAIHVPDLVVKPGQGPGTGLQATKGDQALSFSIDTWALDAPTWTLANGRLNLVQGAIHVPMSAGKPASNIDFPFTGMSVTPTALEGGSFGGGPVLLGGFVPMQVTGDITFLRDTPSSPWRLFGDGGRIAALPGMAAKDEVKIQSWNFQSDGAKHFSMEPGASVRLHQTGDLAISTLGITASTVSFAGGLDLHIPGLKPQAAVIDYARASVGSPPTLKFNPINIAAFDIGGPLVSVQQGVLDATGFHGNGSVTVPDKFTVKSAFLRTPLGPSEKIQALPLTDATLDVGKIAVRQLSGGAKVAAGKWATDYQGHLDVNGQVSGDLSIGVKGTNVNAGTGGLAVKNIATPFGNMAITMNFPEQRLEGSVETDKEIAAGAHVKGTSEMVISGDPSHRYWYFFTGAAFSLKTPHLSGSAALLIGDATLDAGLLGRFKSYGKRDVPAIFRTVSGFYMEGAASIPVPVCPNGSFDIGVADVAVWCNVTGDLRLGANFQQANSYLIGIGAGIDAGIKGGVGLGLCLHVSGEVKASLDGEGAYRSDGAWYARGRADLDLLGGATYGVGIDDLCLDYHTSFGIGLAAEAQVGHDWASNIGPHAKVWFK